MLLVTRVVVVSLSRDILDGLDYLTPLSPLSLWTVPSLPIAVPVRGLSGSRRSPTSPVTFGDGFVYIPVRLLVSAV